MAENSKTIGIISIKGGVGKTTVVSNLGAALAKGFNRKVLLVDANFTAPNLGLHLGIVKPDLTIHDVLFDNVPAQEAVIKTEFGFDLIPGCLNPKKHQQRRINPYKLHNRLAPLKDKYDVILIDSSPNLNDEMLSTMIASDDLLVVSSPDFPTLSCTLNAVNTAKQRKTPIAGIVLNRVRNKRYELKPADIEYATSVPVLSTVCDDSKVLESLSKTTPALLRKPKRDFSIEYSRLAARMLGVGYEDPRLKTKLKNLKNIFRKS
ncbi:TPA: AAA family ATPase, partial [Candidatus Woesearchaeota archaeon]|nr:AAA family ATPase [Candidatus Woesearchaeota archaeon]